MRAFWVCLVLALGAPTIAAAQSALEVVVLDRAGGKAVAGATIALSNPETGFSASGTTDANGKLLFPALTPAGAYVASMTPGSGAAISSSPIRLRSNFTSSVTLLRDAAPIEQITVTGNRVRSNLNFTNAEVSGSLSAEDLVNLPVEGRDLATVLYRLPNVTQSTGFFNEAPSISINGANGLFTQYLVDGLDNNENFLGGQKFPTPVGMIRDVTVLANSYSVEFGRTANGIVNVTTKSGSNNFEFEPFFLWRPGSSVDASQDFSSRDLSGNAVLDGFKRYQGGFAVGGPIVRDQTFFFVDLESTRDDKDNRLTVPALGVNETIKGENKLDYLTLRLDQTWNEEWSSTLRVNRGDVEIERQGGGLEGGLTFPSAGDVQDRESNLTAFTTRYSGGRLSYVGELQYATFDWNFGDAKVDGPQATLLGPDGSTIGVIGNNGFFFDLDERTVQTKHKFTVNFDRWRLNTGIDYLRADFELTGGGNPAGNYTVMLNNAQLAAVRAANRGAALGVNDIPSNVQVVNYGVELRPARFGTDQTLIGLWTEAQIDFTEKLTANFGVRYDYDDLTKFGTGDADDDNISPRFGFNYRLSDTRVIRGGAGIYYEKLPYVVVSDAFQRNADTPGFRQQLAQLVALGRLPADTDIDRVVRNGNLTVSPPAPVFLQGPTGAQLAGQGNNLTASERQIINPFGYNNPYSVQFSLGYQQTLADQWLFETNLIYNRGHDLVRLIDVNSPAPFAGITAQQAATLTPAQLQALVRTPAQADATRPTQPPPGGSNSILISDTGGRSEYKALTLGVTKERGDDFYGARVAYTLSRLENNTDDINFRAQDANNFGDEFAPSLNDRKHVVSAILYLYPLSDLSVSLAGLYQSGQPINFGPDAALFGTTDLNGDGRSFTNQFTGNPDRAPGRGRNSGRLSSSTTFDLGAQYKLPMFNDGKLELSVDVFNVFNEVNLSGYAVNATASNQFQVAGRPFQTRSADRPRTFQFGARYLF